MPQHLSSSALAWYQRIRPARWAADAPLPCIDEVFEQQALRTPRKVILIDDSGYLTYAALRAGIDTRAAALLRRCARESQPACIGVWLENDLQKIITYFACLKAGLIYTPLEHYPAAVMERILEQVPIRVLVTQRRFASTLPAGCREHLALFQTEDEACHPGGDTTFPPSDPLRTAHIAFTTGTQTGIPKGVMTDHVGSMLSHAWRSRLWPYDPEEDVVGCNIFGIWDVVPALCHGIPVVLIPDATMRDPFALASFISRYGITRLMMTPTLLGACLACEDSIDGLRRLRLLVLCGELVAPAIVERAWAALGKVRLVNLYSLAECHDVAAGELTPGKRIANGTVADFAEVHLVDPDHGDRLVPVGSPGRIRVGGRALARGYYGDPERTAERFIEIDLPTPDGGCRRTRVYDTGDLGRFHDSGELEILGRCDADIKIRGSWVNLSAVERIVEQHPAVGRACVVAETDLRGQPELSAFVVPQEASVEGASLTRQLRPYLASQLLEHSIPSRFVAVHKLPLLPSGKVDRHQLRTLRHPPASPPAGQAPSALEQQVLAAFREVLDDPRVGLDDDFQAMGGHSLRAIMLCGALHQTTGRRVAVRDLYRYPTPAALARYLQAPQSPRAGARWRLPELDADIGPFRGIHRSRPLRTVLVTGGTGFLGAFLMDMLLRTTSMRIVALVRAKDADGAHQRLKEAFDRYGLRARDLDRQRRLTALPGDLAKPCMGLVPEVFADLASKIEAICHLAAELDMFADYEDIESVNVGGTREVVRLAFRSGAPIHYVSSSAVFPLDGQAAWSEQTFGLDAMTPLSAALLDSGADGYSLTKYAAEILLWSAFDRGLPVSVVRVPHLSGHTERIIRNPQDRLMMTVRAWIAAGVFPEGDWTWQFAPVDAVCQTLVSRLRTGPSPDSPVRHVTLEPLRAAQVLDRLQSRGIELDLLPLPALVTALTTAARQVTDRDANGPNSQAVCAVAQLVLQHGPRAALNLSDPLLLTRAPFPGDPATLFDSTLDGIVTFGASSCRQKPQHIGDGSYEYQLATPVHVAAGRSTTTKKICSVVHHGAENIIRL